MMPDAFTKALQRALAQALTGVVRTVPVTIAGTNPLTVTLPDGATIPGLAIQGYTYSLGGHAVALLSEPSIPPILPTS